MIDENYSYFVLPCAFVDVTRTMKQSLFCRTHLLRLHAFTAHVNVTATAVAAPIFPKKNQKIAICSYAKNRSSKCLFDLAVDLK